jgi:hypothetical protein
VLDGIRWNRFEGVRCSIRWPDSVALLRSSLLYVSIRLVDVTIGAIRLLAPRGLVTGRSCVRGPLFLGPRTFLGQVN